MLLTFLLACSCRYVSQKEKIKQPQNTPLTCAPQVNDWSWYASGQKAPLFKNLGAAHFAISTDNDLVQKYFDQGLALAYGFNHAEAARSFYYASQLEPDCAMAFWGYAFVLGPNYNEAMEAVNYPKSHQAIQNALRLRQSCTFKERSLIEALALRYVEEAPENRWKLDEAYAKAMGQVMKLFPEDANIAALYAESLMNLHPWELYSREGEALPWTPEIIQVLNHALKIDPDNLGAHHYMIHAVEASANPEKGLPSAARFDSGLAPGLGHLIHMPSHIYIRTGDYQKGTVANVRALEVDSAYVGACHAQGTYPLALYPHNYHFLVATATLSGNKRWAVRAAERIEREVSPQIMQMPGWSTLQHYASIPYNVYVKFGLWDKILNKENSIKLPYNEGMRHYARGIAFSARGDLAKAERELEQLITISKKPEINDLTIWDINSMQDLILIAIKVLSAEIELHRNNVDKSLKLLHEAVAIEDALNYNEPPDWFFSVRHKLGNVLLQNGQYNSAIEVYKADLKTFPKNGWALNGLSSSYEQLGMKEEAVASKALFQQAWNYADIRLEGSMIKLN